MYLYIQMGPREYHLIAKGTEKALDKLWNSIDRLNKGKISPLIMTVKELGTHA